MPFTVITLKNTPKSLRGDLTKWMQEIATGVYVGNFNSKVREEIWNRVLESSGVGEATLSYYYRNEIGYNFETHNADRNVIDYEGIPLIIVKSEETHEEENDKHGYSKASKFHKARKYTSTTKKEQERTYVILDIETDGLDERTNKIIEIGAIKASTKEEFHKKIKIDTKLPKEITKLTGITDKELEEGEEILESLKELKEFIGYNDIVGYGVKFDIKFINRNLQLNGLDRLTNKTWDLMDFVKREKSFLENYKLEMVLKSYGIDKKVPHRALEDSRLIDELSGKVQKFQEFLKKKP